MEKNFFMPAEIKVLGNHIYEYKKGVRNLVLFTVNREYEKMAIDRLSSNGIHFCVQKAGTRNINLYFGKPECIETIRRLIDKPLNRLTPEEDFILGALLGYDLCMQCQRFCERKNKYVSLA